MDKINKIIAREWLLLVGVLLCSIPIHFIFSPKKFGESFGIALSLYIVVQFIRSILWAIRILRNPSEQNSEPITPKLYTLGLHPLFIMAIIMVVLILIAIFSTNKSGYSF